MSNEKPKALVPETTTKKQEVSQPPFDPHELLDLFKGVVEKNTGPPASDGGGGSAKSWVSALIIFAVVLAGMAVWAWISFSRDRELAKLRHEKNKAAILKKQAEIFAELAENDLEIAEAQKGLDKIDEKLAVIVSDIRAEEERYAADMRAIDSIRSWRDAGIR